MRPDNSRMRVGIVIVMVVATVYAWILIAMQTRYMILEYWASDISVASTVMHHVRTMPLFVAIPILPTFGTYVVIMLLLGWLYRWAYRPATFDADIASSPSLPRL